MADPTARQAQLVIEAGKPLFIDKPVAGSLADAVAIYDLARNIRFLVSPVRRCDLGRRSSVIVIRKPRRPCRVAAPGEPVPFSLPCPICSTTVCMAWKCSLRSWEPDARRSHDPVRPTRISSWGSGMMDGSGPFAGFAQGKPSLARSSTRQSRSRGSNGPTAIDHSSKKSHVSSAPGVPPVRAEETIEMFAFMEAADQSLHQAGVPVSLQTVLQQARDANRP